MPDKTPYFYPDGSRLMRCLHDLDSGRENMQPAADEEILAQPCVVEALDEEKTKSMNARGDAAAMFLELFRQNGTDMERVLDLLERFADHLRPNQEHRASGEDVLLAQPCVVEALRKARDGRDEDLEQGLRNLGIDPTCGACMEVFYTGMTMARHTCPEAEEHGVVVVMDEVLGTQGGDR